MRQGKSRIVVPRADVASIEKTPPKPAAAPAAGPSTGPSPGDKPPGEADRLETLERMLEKIETGRDTKAAANRAM